MHQTSNLAYYYLLFLWQNLQEYSIKNNILVENVEIDKHIIVFTNALNCFVKRLLAKCDVHERTNYVKTSNNMFMYYLLNYV